MLYVNLVEDRLQQRRTADLVLSLGSLLLLVLVAALVGSIAWYRIKAVRIESSIHQTKAKTAEIQPDADTAKVLEDQIGVLRPVQDLAKQVHGTQAQWCLVLDGIGLLLPPGVSLSEVSSITDPVTQARKVRLRGLADNKELVSAYIEALNNWKWFDRSGTLLTDLGTQQLGGLEMASFSLELLVAGTAVKKQEAKQPVAAPGKEAKQ